MQNKLGLLVSKEEAVKILDARVKSGEEILKNNNRASTIDISIPSVEMWHITNKTTLSILFEKDSEIIKNYGLKGSQKSSLVGGVDYMKSILMIVSVL